MALVEDVEHALHRLRARDVRLVRAAVEVVGVGRRGLQPRHDRADPLAGRDVVVDDRAAGRAGGGERQRDDHAGAVLAGRAVDDRGAVGVRGVAERVDDRVGAVAQVAEVGADGGRLDARAVAVAAALDPRHHRLDVDVGVLAGLGVERAVADLRAAVAHERPGALERDLGAGPQVDDEADADRVDERADVGGLRPWRLSARSRTPGAVVAAVLERQPAEVAHVDRAVEADPAFAHASSLRSGPRPMLRSGDRGYPRRMTLRRLILLPVLLAALVAVAGCGGDDEGSGGAGPAPRTSAAT